MEEEFKEYMVKEGKKLLIVGGVFIGVKYLSRWMDSKKTNSVKDFILEDFLEFKQVLNDGKEKIGEIIDEVWDSKYSTILKPDGVYFKVKSNKYGDLETKLNSNKPVFIGSLGIIPKRKKDSAISVEFFAKTKEDIKFSYFQDMIPKDKNVDFSQREYKFKSKFNIS